MSAAPGIERRRYARRASAARVQFHHAPTHREFPARCVNVSDGGLLMFVPAATPVKSGQPILLFVDEPHRKEFLQAGPIEATVVRVDRQKLLDAGHLAVGVRFGLG